MDAATVLEQYVSDLVNLPAELAHILEEIGDRDLKFYDTRKRIQQRDNQIHKFIRAHGSLAENPKEGPSYPKIRADFEKAMQLQQQKCDLSNTGLYIIAKHLKRLDDDINKLQNENMLAPPPPAAESSPEPEVTRSRSAARSRAQSIAASSAIAGEKRSSPAPSRGGTPAARLPKRQKTASVAARESTLSDSEAESTSPALVRNKNQLHLDQLQLPQFGEEEETLYCTCQQVSFGNMVACDNPDCQYEWFHYACVGLTAPPSGTWYCPTCTKERKERDFKETKRRK
ncbi:chromatin modification-related protein Yng2p [Trichomonascus vanleenenianus]|uniref:histone acetyltransferase YNG2 n=1 Tax=Trichomonascus vanleenenianus TaxID=2268995 RepID=UPI003ECA6ACD